MKHAWLFFGVLALIGPWSAHPQEGVSAGLLWAGSWGLNSIKLNEDGDLTTGSGYLINRGDLKVNVLNVTARFQALDKRPALFWDQNDMGVTAFSGGLCHNHTGSRLLYGVIDEWGLSARLRNPWGKTLPFADARRPLSADLKTEPSSSRESEAYLYLGLPRLGMFRPFASVQVDSTRNPSMAGGADLGFVKKTSLRAEGFYTEKRLASELRYENWARPGLWGFRAGNRPVLPGGDFGLAEQVRPLLNLLAGVLEQPHLSQLFQAAPCRVHGFILFMKGAFAYMKGTLAYMKGTFARPKRAVARPKRAVARPKRAVARPKRTTARPKRAVARPKRVIARPKKAFARPKRVIARSKGAFARPKGVLVGARGTFFPRRNTGGRDKRMGIFTVELCADKPKVTLPAGGLTRRLPGRYIHN